MPFKNISSPSAAAQFSFFFHFLKVFQNTKIVHAGAKGEYDYPARENMFVPELVFFPFSSAAHMGKQ